MHGIGIFAAIQAAQRHAARIRMRARVIQRGFKIGDEVLDGGGVGSLVSRWRHHAAAQFAHGLFPDLGIRGEWRHADMESNATPPAQSSVLWHSKQYVWTVFQLPWEASLAAGGRGIVANATRGHGQATGGENGGA